MSSSALDRLCDLFEEIVMEAKKGDKRESEKLLLLEPWERKLAELIREARNGQ